VSPLETAARIAVELFRVGFDLLDGTETPEGAHRRVRDILPEEGESERAARELAASMRLERLAEGDDPGVEPPIHADEDEQTWPGQR
jgi:hypothetical protein